MDAIVQALKSIATALANPWQLFYTAYTSTGSAGGTFYYMRVGPIKIVWGITNAVACSNPGTSFTVSIPSGVFSTILSITANPLNLVAQANQFIGIASYTTTLLTCYSCSPGGAGTNQASFIVVGV